MMTLGRTSALLGLAGSLLFTGLEAAAAPKGKAPAKPAEQPVDVRKVDALPIVRKEKAMTNLALQQPPSRTKLITPEELDGMIVDELVKEGMNKSTQRLPDDQFLRRAFLDVLGRLPDYEEIEKYLSTRDKDKKAHVIDWLLEQPEFGRNQARYWRDVIKYRATDVNDVRRVEKSFEDWLSDQFNDNESWDRIANKIITGTGVELDSPQIFFIMAHQAKAPELAGEMSRVFLGIQIQCAECHDHPSDVWKRQQFHEFASFFSKFGVRTRRDLETPKMRNVREVFTRKADWKMPDLKNPTAPGEMMDQVFLSGQKVTKVTAPEDTVEAVARMITTKRNPFFAKSFVNRVWQQLMGYGFTNPVDNLGKNSPVVYPKVFEGMSDSFAASNYDIKKLFKTVMNTKTYERRFQEIEGSFGEDVMFASIQPSRLSSDQIADSLESLLNGVEKDAQNRKQARRSPIRNELETAFGYDPSSNTEDLEGTIPQALLMMNSGYVGQRLSAASKDTLLNRIIKKKLSDAETVKDLYLNVLAREPRPSEVEACLKYLKTSKTREEGFEDILWSMLNSTEFLYNN